MVPRTSKSQVDVSTSPPLPITCDFNINIQMESFGLNAPSAGDSEFQIQNSDSLEF